MPFDLEAPDIALTKAQRKALYDAMLAAFTFDELDQLVYLELGETLSQITMGANLATAATQFMQWLERFGRVGEFVDIAYRQRPNNVQLRAIAKELGFMAEAPPKARLEQLLKQFASEFEMAPGLSQDHQFERMLEAFARDLNLRPALQATRETSQERMIPGQYTDIALMLGWLANAARRVCAIHNQGGFTGTGFLVGQDSVLTTYSVVSQLIDAGNFSNCFCRFDYAVQGDHINQGDYVGLSTSQPLIDFSPYSQADVSVEKAAELPGPAELDYALLRLASDVGKTRGWYSLPSVTPAPDNAMIYLAHHPAGQPLKLSHPPGKLYRRNDNGTRYEIVDSKTEPGSAGAPCFDEHGNIIALYHAKDRRVFRPEGLGKAIPLHLICDLLLSRGVQLS
jgi:hypothetical protein